MKAIMKISAVVIMALIFANSTFAKENENTHRIDLARKGYVEALKSDLTVLRNNALLQIIKMKSDYSEVEFPELKRLVKKMSESDPSLVLRTNAQLTFTIMENPYLTTLVNAYDYEEPNHYFDDLYLKLAEGQVAMQVQD